MTDLDARAAILRQSAYDSYTLDIWNDDSPDFLAISETIREAYKRVFSLPLKTPLAPRTPERIQAEELLRFEDAEFIENAYARLLHRDADDSAFEYLLRLRGGEMTKEDIIFALSMSREGRKIGAVVEGVRVTHLDSEPLLRGGGYRFVEGVYNWLLGRKADATGLKEGVKLLRGGMAKGDYLSALATCPERADLQPRPDGAAGADVVLYADLMRFDDCEYIVALYERLLGRTPDAPSASRYLAALRAGAMTKDEALFSIRMSEEGRQRDVFIAEPRLERMDAAKLMALDAPAFISAIYMWVFGRRADEAGLSHNLGLMARGMGKREMLLALLGSGEAAGKPITEYLLRRAGENAICEDDPPAPILADDAQRAEADLRRKIDLIALRRELEALSGALSGQVAALQRREAAASIRAVVAQRRAEAAERQAADAMSRLEDLQRRMAEQAAAMEARLARADGE